MYLTSRVKWVKNHQANQLNPIIHAMKMMADGNFNIDLSNYKDVFKGGGRDHPYFKIIESIDHMAERLGEMEEMRQEFISNVSHEIQSPLTSIGGFAHALKHETLTSKERKRYLEIIEVESNRLSKLSDNLLKLTTLDSDDVPCEHTQYRLDHQLRRIILSIEPQWSDKELNMKVSLNPVSISADVDLMDQVWINLLTNAIKFSSKEGTISVSVTETNDQLLCVKIQDTGIGMSKDMLIHIFERFYKADQSRNRNAEGNGLGLSIVQKIVELHNGSIQVVSELGKGSRFTVLLPVGIEGS